MTGVQHGGGDGGSCSRSAAARSGGAVARLHSGAKREYIEILDDDEDPEMEQQAPKFARAESSKRNEGGALGKFFKPRGFYLKYNDTLGDLVYLPAGMIQEIGALDGERVVIKGPSDVEHTVRVELDEHGPAFGSGWAMLREVEQFAVNKTITFSFADVFRLEMTVYQTDGLERRGSGHVLVDVKKKTGDFYFRNLPPDAELDEDCYMLSPSVQMSGSLFDTLGLVWDSCKVKSMLYAAVVTENMVKKSHMYFVKEYYVMLPDGESRILIRYADSNADIVEGKIRKADDGISRITTGWSTFCRLHNVIVGSVHVFRFSTRKGGLRVAVYPI